MGSELLAALDQLASENPAKWNLAALGCRNVVIKLGRILWTVETDEYASTLLGRTLNLKGETEKNRLSAYIDVHWRSAAEAEKNLLEEAHGLVLPVYDLGSKGKSGQIRHGEAQQLVVDTFRLVDLLRQAAGVTPIATPPDIRRPGDV